MGERDAFPLKKGCAMVVRADGSSVEHFHFGLKRRRCPVIRKAGSGWQVQGTLVGLIGG